MDARPNRRDLIKMGVVAGGIAAAGPVITTFNVPAAAALTSACTCTNAKILFQKELVWDGVGVSWDPVVSTAGSCRPSCWEAGALPAGTSRITTSTSINSPMLVVRGSNCNSDANEGLFAITALYTTAGDTDCVGTPGNGSILFVGNNSATITAAAGKTIARVFVVACC